MNTALITKIHATQTMAVVVVTGGGMQAVADLLAVPGASRTVLEALVPYSQASQTAFLGQTVDQSVTAEAGAAFAQAAYRRAIELRESAAAPVIGLACTAALATDRPKKGDHRAHIGLTTADGTTVSSVILQKGARDRVGEEQVVSDLIVSILAQACGLEEPARVEFLVELLAEEHVTIQHFP
jgi:nicotinamide mononucleotide (NMN) deamidase PncC